MEGIAALRERLPDLVISDIVMPNMDGLAMFAAITADEGLWTVPVVMLTALSGSEDVLRALESRADGFILKPFDEEFLFSSIERALAQRDLGQDEFYLAGGRGDLLVFPPVAGRRGPLGRRAGKRGGIGTGLRGGTLRRAWALVHPNSGVPSWVHEAR